MRPVRGEAASLNVVKPFEGETCDRRRILSDVLHRWAAKELVLGHQRVTSARSVLRIVLDANATPVVCVLISSLR